MANQYWLVKQEPSKYSFAQLQKDGRTTWDGVRNYQARNNLQAMRRGDVVLFYHSNAGPETAVIGACKVVREAFPDPSTDDARWVAVELAPVRALKRPVTLEQIKGEAKLQQIGLIRQSRLSVMPLTETEYQTILELGS